MRQIKELLFLVVALSQVGLGNILVKMCQPTDFKGVIQQQEIFSMTVDAEFGTKVTTYLVGGHAQ